MKGRITNKLVPFAQNCLWSEKIKIDSVFKTQAPPFKVLSQHAPFSPLHADPGSVKDAHQS